MRIGIPLPGSRSPGVSNFSRSGLLRLGAFGFAAATADGDVAQDASFSPVASAALAEVSRLGKIIVVVVAKLGVQRIATGAL